MEGSGEAVGSSQHVIDNVINAALLVLWMSMICFWCLWSAARLLVSARDEVGDTSLASLPHQHIDTNNADDGEHDDAGDNGGNKEGNIAQDRFIC